MRAAIAPGYPKGFHTIVDANVVTCITAFVLFAVATAEVKGFALMLLLGTVISLVTAVAATRAMLGLLAGFRWFDNPRFMGAKGQAISSWQRVDVNSPKRRRIYLSVATVLIVASALAIGLQGPQPRHRLQGRHAGHVQEPTADFARRPCATRRGRSAAATRSSRAAASRPAATGTRASRSARSR